MLAIKKDTVKILKNHPYSSQVFHAMSTDEKLKAVDLLSKKGAIPYDMFRTGSELLDKEFPTILLQVH